MILRGHQVSYVETTSSYVEDGSRVLCGHTVSYVETNSSYAEDSSRILCGRKVSYLETNSSHAEDIAAASHVDKRFLTWRHTPPIRRMLCPMTKDLLRGRGE
jgi:hypothetical protein